VTDTAPAEASVRVLMIGWEFPPAVSGGLGAACEGLVRGLGSLGCEIVLLLPRRPRKGGRSETLPGSFPSVKMIASGTRLVPYGTASGLYGDDLRDEVSRLAAVARVVARRETFDVVHVHDWMTFPAGLAASEASGRPLIAHVHATEFSRSAGEGGDPFIRGIERAALRRADRVLCVSRFTAGVVRRRYGVDPLRIRIIHNAIDGAAAAIPRSEPAGPPLVLFAGRLTRQKGPARFLDAARLIHQRHPDARFVMAGAGDRLDWLRSRADELGLHEAVKFPGFLEPSALMALYGRASVYVLPSVAEPFGLTVLEALRQGVPTVAARLAGVTEVVHSVVRVDAGNVGELAGRIIRLLDSPRLRARLSRMGRAEVARMSWRAPAARCLDVYREVA
jgi:glycogen synthase